MSLTRRPSISRALEIDAYEGWLMKKKSGGKSFLGTDTRRWFKVKEMKGLEVVELGFCYFTSQRDKEARGWVYLKDVVEIYDDEKTFTIVSAARSMTMEATTLAEHRFWIQGLVALCPQAKTTGIRTKISVIRAESKESKDESIEGSRFNRSDSKDLPESSVADSKAEEVDSSSGRKRSSSRSSRNEDLSEESSQSGALAVNSSRSDREDHRLSGSGYRNGNAATSRLHDHIRSRDQPGDRNGNSPDGSLTDEKSIDGDEDGSRDGGRGEEASSRDRGERGDADRDDSSTGDVEDLEEEVLGATMAGRSRAAARRQQRRGGGGYIEGADETADAKDQRDSAARAAGAEAGAGRKGTDGADVEGGPGAAGKPKKRPPPPPKNAPPRRAAEVLLAEDEEEDGGAKGSGAPRSSIEDLLAAARSRSRSASRELIDGKDTGSDEEAENDAMDFKAERERRGSHGSLVIATVLVSGAGSTGGASLISPAVSARPPRPPAGVKAPYGQKKAPPAGPAPGVGPGAGPSSAVRSSTPPRQAAHPGATVDPNFVNENWDEEDDSESAQRDRDSSNAGADSRKGKKAQAMPGAPGVDAGVRSDPQWIDDDFDS